MSMSVLTSTAVQTCVCVCLNACSCCRDTEGLVMEVVITGLGVDICRLRRWMIDLSVKFYPEASVCCPTANPTDLHEDPCRE